MRILQLHYSFKQKYIYIFLHRWTFFTDIYKRAWRWHSKKLINLFVYFFTNKRVVLKRKILFHKNLIFSESFFSISSILLCRFAFTPCISWGDTRIEGWPLCENASSDAKLPMTITTQLEMLIVAGHATFKSEWPFVWYVDSSLRCMHVCYMMRFNSVSRLCPVMRADDTLMYGWETLSVTIWQIV